MQRVAGRDGSKTRLAALRYLARPRYREDGLHAALDVSQAILAGVELDAVLQMIAEWARLLVEADGAAVRIADAGNQALVLRGVSERPGKHGLRPFLARELPVRGSICGGVFETGHARLFSDLWRGTRRLPGGVACSHHPEAVQRELCGPALLVPLHVQDGTFGVLMASNAAGRMPFRKHDLETLDRFGCEVALAIREAHVLPDQDRLALIEERRRLGRDLHDGAIQSLYAVTLRLNAAVERAQDGRLEEQLAGLTARIDAVIADLREHVYALRSGAGDSAVTGD
jgi:signal transduction histidine kinase